MSCTHLFQRLNFLNPFKYNSNIYKKSISKKGCLNYRSFCFSILKSNSNHSNSNHSNSNHSTSNHSNSNHSMLKKSGVLLFRNGSFITDNERFDHYLRNTSSFVLPLQTSSKPECNGIFDGGISNPKDNKCQGKLAGYFACNGFPIVYFCDVHKSSLMIKCACGKTDEIYGYIGQNKRDVVCIQHYRFFIKSNVVVKAEYTIHTF